MSEGRKRNGKNDGERKSYQNTGLTHTKQWKTGTFMRRGTKKGEGGLTTMCVFRVLKRKGGVSSLGNGGGRGSRLRLPTALRQRLRRKTDPGKEMEGGSVFVAKGKSRDNVACKKEKKEELNQGRLKTERRNGMFRRSRAKKVQYLKSTLCTKGGGEAKRGPLGYKEAKKSEKKKISYFKGPTS